MLNNLLSNAFKYQRRDEQKRFVKLSIEVSDKVAILKVEDNGIGIHESHIDNIFNIFYRATSEQSGSGFGLFNVKDALSKLGGQIQVSSKLNEGTSFIVTLPGK